MFCSQLLFYTRGLHTAAVINIYHLEIVLSIILKGSVSEFNEFKPRLKSPKTRFQWSAGVNLEKLNTILSETNHI